MFSARCVKVGLEADVAALKQAGITTLARVAFMSSYTPGSGDDKELIAAFETALGPSSFWLKPFGSRPRLLEVVKPPGEP